MADIFNTEVVTLKVGEGAAYGAALQAFWCWRLQKGEKIRIEAITDEFVTLNKAETTTPKKAPSRCIASCRSCRTTSRNRCAAFSRSTGNRWLRQLAFPVNAIRVDRMCIIFPPARLI